MNIHTMPDGTKIDLNEQHNGTRNGTFEATHYKTNANGWHESFDVCICDGCGGLATEPNTVKVDRPLNGSQPWPAHLPIPSMIAWSDELEDAVCETCCYKASEAEEAKDEWALLREFVERMDSLPSSGDGYRTVLNYMDTLERRRD